MTKIKKLTSAQAAEINKAAGIDVGISMKRIPSEETPLDNRLILLEDAPPTRTASGLYLPETSAEKPYTGLVLAVGPKCEALEAGDRVRYAMRAGDKITIDNQEYLMLRETDIYTKLKK